MDEALAIEAVRRGLMTPEEAAAQLPAPLAEGGLLSKVPGMVKSASTGLLKAAVGIPGIPGDVVDFSQWLGNAAGSATGLWNPKTSQNLPGLPRSSPAASLFPRAGSRARP